MKRYNIKEFSETPGGRYRKHGSKSGEEFRDDILISLVKKSIIEKEYLIINLDGVYGLPHSFLEEVFGGLIRYHKFDIDDFKYVILTTNDKNDKSIDRIIDYIKEAAHNEL